MDDNKFIVRVSCMTYNHASYIEDALNGFCMQATTFPFVCTIVDDSSIDGEPEVIMKYFNSHFDTQNDELYRYEETDDYFLSMAQHKNNKNCYFVVILLKYNHYSINKTKIPYLKRWSNTKYIALCEGDDYWTDSKKLQTQVDFLNSHPRYTMTCTRASLYSQKKQRMIGESYCYRYSRRVSVKDMINRTGLFVSTCSIVCRKEIYENKPDYWKKCKVGDYPLQIACVLRGNVWYFNKIMCVYRVDNSTSWVGSKKTININNPIIIETLKSEVNMFKGFACDFPNYRNILKYKIADQINRFVAYRNISEEEKQNYLHSFEDELISYTIRWRIDLFIRTSKLPYIGTIYERFFMRKYSPKLLRYKYEK